MDDGLIVERIYPLGLEPAVGTSLSIPIINAVPGLP
jgi:hypothetical protein